MSTQKVIWINSASMCLLYNVSILALSPTWLTLQKDFRFCCSTTELPQRGIIYLHICVSSAFLPLPLLFILLYLLKIYLQFFSIFGYMKICLIHYHYAEKTTAKSDNWPNFFWRLLLQNTWAGNSGSYHSQKYDFQAVPN